MCSSMVGIEFNPKLAWRCTDARMPRCHSTRQQIYTNVAHILQETPSFVFQEKWIDHVCVTNTRSSVRPVRPCSGQRHGHDTAVHSYVSTKHLSLNCSIPSINYSTTRHQHHLNQYFLLLSGCKMNMINLSPMSHQTQKVRENHLLYQISFLYF